jgi:acyl-CoA reductase-like NAD-dependent aldehyde dehydrogenase
MTPRTAPIISAGLIIEGATIATARSGEVRSPATGMVVGSYALAEREHVERAVTAASAAFAAWSRLTGAEREAAMRRATAHARGRADEIGRLMALEQGKPFAQSRAEVIGACDLIDYYAAEAVRIEGSVLPTEKADLRSLVVAQPLGVVAAITPWNYPVALLSWKLGPALAAGCSVVVKPTPVTPLSPFAFCRALCDGGLPPGLIGFLTGEDVVVGEALVTHPRVAKVAFTGSTATGRTLLRIAGPLFKKLTLELGGHCPAIVCEDADLALAAKAIAYKAFRNQGQSCSSINRIYAHATIHDRLVELVSAEAAKLSMGDGLEPPDVDLGPMTTRAARDKVVAHVADAVARGARVVCGGTVPADRPGAGHWYLPTVITGLKSDMLMAREETFGPVAPFASYTDLDEAIRLANDSEFGLCAFLFTRDLARTIRIGERLEAGSVCVNHIAVNTAYGPYEGWKASGVGVELGRGAIHEYLKRKHLKIAVPACS